MKQILSAILLLVCSYEAVAAGERHPYQAQRATARKLYSERNYKESYDAYLKFVFKKDADVQSLSADLSQAVECLRQLRRNNELDTFLEKMAVVHADEWRVMQALGDQYLNLQHYGFLVAGKFQRGHHRGGGEWILVAGRDRVRALQLYRQAVALEQGTASEQAGLHFAYARAMVSDREYSHSSWKLQRLTDLDTLPDYGERDDSSASGVPLDADGKVLFYTAPESFESAANDGERWRALLRKAVELDPSRRQAVDRARADFAWQNYGVQTMADYGWYFHRPKSDTDTDESGTYALHTLEDDETIARTAGGIRRFKLPPEYRFPELYQQLEHYSKVAEVRENRRQYPRAAEAWRMQIQKYGRTQHLQQRLEQIVDNWGQFDAAPAQPSGSPSSLEYTFRNGSRVEFAAQKLDVEKVLADVKAYIRGNPERLDWQRTNIEAIGYRIVQENEKRFLLPGKQTWALELEPAPNHFDRWVAVEMPMKEPGAYLVTAKMKDGNTSRVILWVNDLAIVEKRMDTESTGGPKLFYLADAATGEPIADATLTVFGYWSKSLPQEKRTGRRYANIHCNEFAVKTDAQGMAIPAKERMGKAEEAGNLNCLTTAHTKDGRFAFSGFTRTWFGRLHDAEYKMNKGFFMTDRPVYRPGHKVEFKAWLRHARYDMPDASSFAGKSFHLVVHNPRNEEIFNKQFTADAYGGMGGSLELPENATLGVYRISVAGEHNARGTFRVEEYKKPEFKVTVHAPEKPIMLGEKIEVTAQADYYFGAPVVEAVAKVKVLRKKHSADWFPPRPWDWFYGPGYWWFGYDYDWYPGWHHWGCRRPVPFWWNHSYEQPEVIADMELEIGADGSITIPIDTAPALAMHGGSDHQYDITVEVTDASRRTIVGTGKVLVARKPFKVYSWMDKGYYRVGDTAQARIHARTVDGKPVSGTGVAKLFRISYDKERNPIEHPVSEWSIQADMDGNASIQLKASRSGQYRFLSTITDAEGHRVEGGHLFVVRGDGDDGKNYRFNEVEIVPDKAEYAPGEKTQLLVNAEQPGATVLLFVRPSNGIYLKPKVIKLKGRSAMVPLDVVQKDMPNFYVEALTVAGGAAHTELKNIAVPPQKRMLSVEVGPSKERYKPGESARVRIALKDENGAPYVGAAVLAVYDSSLEYISGGSNVGDIKSFFWKWKRHHRPATESNLQRTGYDIQKTGETPMNFLGIFGAGVADEVQTGQGGVGSMGGLKRPKMPLKMLKAKSSLQPASAPGMVADGFSMEVSDIGFDAEGGDRGPGNSSANEPVVRSNFADTAYWNGAIETDSNGVANVEFEMPENLTGWTFKVWAMGQGTRVGEGSATAVTSKDLLLRMQAPRFFVETDEVVLSANIHNYLDADQKVQAVLELDGDELELLGDAEQSVHIAANGEARVDWRVKALKEGEAVVRMKALASDESDAMQMSYPVLVRGIEKVVSFSGHIRPEAESASLIFDLPEKRRPEETMLTIRWSPTLAGALVDALPYLADYPYGCTEQTISRFLPAVMTRKVLSNMDIDLAELDRVRASLNAQEIGDPAERAKGWKRYDRQPLYDSAELDRMIDFGLGKLYSMQCADGGWGWFSGAGEYASGHTTAYVVHGLQKAREADLAVAPANLKRGIEWLKRHQEEQVARILDEDDGKSYPDNLDAFIFMVLADENEVNRRMRESLYEDRAKLSPYGLACLGLAFDKLEEPQKRDMLIRNIEQYLVQDAENQTAYLRLSQTGYRWWYWYGDEIESMAYYLKLLSRTAPESDKASGLVKYLLNNRKHATYWKSTRDTAICIEAMCEYLSASGESAPDMTVEVLVDGQVMQETKVTAENLFAIDNTLLLEGDQLATGKHEITFRKKGKGPLYFNAYLSYFSLEDFIEKTGLEVKVRRKYYKLEKVDASTSVAGARGQAVSQKVEKYQRVPIEHLGEVVSGDLVEVELEIDSKNDYEYILLSDPKPAGFEPVSVRSGYGGRGLRAYIEYRDERVCLFVTRLARGTHSTAYRMRAETPGTFSALPAQVSAMYAPELRGNSDEWKVNVQDR